MRVNESIAEVVLNQVDVDGNKNDLETLVTELPLPAQGLITEYKELFPKELPPDLPPKRHIEHRIDLIEGAKPPSTEMYRMSEYELTELKKQIDDLLAKGFIKPSLSPYGAPCLFMKKKDGSMRLVVDYRKLNTIAIRNDFGLPRSDEQLESIKGSKYFTKLDLHSGFNQVCVRPEDQEKTAFNCRFGTFISLFAHWDL